MLANVSVRARTSLNVAMPRHTSQSPSRHPGFYCAPIRATPYRDARATSPRSPERQGAKTGPLARLPGHAVAAATPQAQRREKGHQDRASAWSIVSNGGDRQDWEFKEGSRQTRKKDKKKHAPPSTNRYNHLPSPKQTHTTAIVTEGAISLTSTQTEAWTDSMRSCRVGMTRSRTDSGSSVELRVT